MAMLIYNDIISEKLPWLFIKLLDKKTKKSFQHFTYVCLI